MTTLKFEKTPTPNESISLDNISDEKVKQAWLGYESKPEYKNVNKHDLIEALQQSNSKDQD
ncbi:MULTISPECIES: NF038105 family protein [unclassified Acinetobacter]|uniref:NF038105 family protein n=1 Tax=unclassified Acinetobacter TaxID=196816 RepID=UPI002934BFBA|nr:MULTISPECIES: NF038105 family protein [unclassified Acinetobacter]WOE31577.1 NF038105 family protein [Acinetobacter sp. SAAs470]WOE39774.1 NF038105 family protein [Acinetobacter sp. SAAs474]